MSTKELIEKTGYSIDELASSSRLSELCTPRHVCMWIMAQNGIKLCVIGRIFKRNHSTVIHAKKKVEDMIITNDQMTKYYIEKLQN
jgi:chromosomal replication initiation ATPase DnaA